MASFSMTHSWRPSTLYKPQWMNMPKRASCHHCMRRARSASCAGELCWGCACALAAAVLVAVASVSNDAPVPTSHSRRGMAFGVISRCPPVVTPIRLWFELENAFHEQPLFSGLGGWKRLLKFPHEFFPFADLGICAVSTGFGIEGKALVDFHDHEHTRAEQINFHVDDAGIFDAGGNFRPDFFVMTAILGDQSRIILEIECEAISFIHTSIHHESQRNGIASPTFRSEHDRDVRSHRRRSHAAQLRDWPVPT